jgi:hypothetical protein
VKLTESVRSRLIEYAGRNVVIGFRPNAVLVIANGEAACEPAPGTVADYEFQGDRWLVHWRTPHGAEITSVVCEGGPPKLGTTHALRLDPLHWHFFTADEQGRRL